MVGDNSTHSRAVVEVRILFLIPTEYLVGFWAWVTSLFNVAKESVGHVCVVLPSRITVLRQRAEAACLAKDMQLAMEEPGCEPGSFWLC